MPEDDGRNLDVQPIPQAVLARPRGTAEPLPETDQMNKHPTDPQIATWLDTSLGSETCADEIEQRIIRTYIRLVFDAEQPFGFRTGTVMRHGPLEFRLTETFENDTNPGMPMYWLEVFPTQHQLSIGRYRMSEFDESEIAGAVEFIIEAARGTQSQDLFLRSSRKPE